MDISFELFKKLCDDLKTMGTNNVFLTGEGEPLLHPRVMDIILTAKEAGLHVTLITNGTLLDETKIQLLIGSRLDAIRVSLWAGSIEEYEKNYPGSDPYNFYKIIEGLRLFSHLKAEQNSKNPFVVLHHPINRNNFNNIDKMVNLTYKAGCNALTFSPVKCWWDTLASLVLSEEEEKFLFQSLRLMEKRLDSLSLKHNIATTILNYHLSDDVWQKLPCYIAWLHARIRVNGAVLPCQRCHLTMGNLNEERLRQIWNGSAFREFRRKAMTPKGMASIGEYCESNLCGWVEDNMRVHRIFKWFSPFATVGN
jgi:MoaA/NifB/PqqE/SkfB family radical SAM enzyme